MNISTNSSVNFGLSANYETVTPRSVEQACINETHNDEFENDLNSCISENFVFSNSNCNAAAQLKYEEVHGEYGTWVFICNNHPSKKISVTIVTKWIFMEQV